MMGRRTQFIASAVGLFLLLAVFAGIYSRVHATSKLRIVAQRAAVASVQVVHPETGNQGAKIDLPGNTVAFTDTPIYARTSGYVKHWYVDIGTHVQQGQLLAEIDAPELDQQLLQARADLMNARANLQIARVTAERWQNLVKTDSVSRQEADQAESDFQAREALADSNAANLKRLEQLVSFERIVAPVSGVITVRNTDIGALIQAGDNAVPKELFHLAATQQLRVYVAVPEIYASSVKVGDAEEVTFASVRGETFKGIVARYADAIDTTSRTVNVEVDVDNSSDRLMPGAYAFVHFRASTAKGAVTIPSNALLFRAEGLQVGVVQDSRVRLRPIVIGTDYGASVQVVSGLAPGDVVVINPADSLADGAQVQIEEEKSAGGST